MDRRSLLKMFGFGAVATALPAMPAAAKLEPPPAPLPQRVLGAMFCDPMYADVYTEGTLGERYCHSHSVNLGVCDHGTATLTFEARFTGTIKSVTLRRGDMDLCYIPASDFDSPYIIRGNTMQLKISIR